MKTEWKNKTERKNKDGKTLNEKNKTVWRQKKRILKNKLKPGYQKLILSAKTPWHALRLETLKVVLLSLSIKG